MSTQPILDLLGVFNLRLRVLLKNLSVLNAEGYVYDPSFVPRVYGGLPSDERIFVLLGRGYWHTNVPFGWMVMRTHFELLSIGVYTNIQNNLDYAVPLFTRGFVGFGIPLSGKFELFGNAEWGALLDVLTNNVQDEDWNETIQQAREKSMYAALRGGITWYYDNHSGLELGYRLILTGNESPVRFMQGYTFTDWVYNVYNFFVASSGSQSWAIPFITTNYYLSFSTKF